MTKIQLEFSIFGDLLNPQLFSETIKLSATSFWYKGDIIPNRKNNLTRKETCWQYSTGYVETLNLDDLFKPFIKKFSYRADIISIIARNNDLETKIDLVIKIDNNETPEVYFDKQFLALVTKLNCEIDIDLYC